MTSLKKTATKLGLRSQDDSIARLKENIISYRNPQDLVGKLRSVATFTSIIAHTRYLRATCKALNRLGKKIKRMKSSQPTYNDYISQMSYLANKLTIQADQYKIGERMIEAIESAELKQAEREVIQDCYANHRQLDKFRGVYRAANTTSMSADKSIGINDILKNAGCSHLFDATCDPECAVMKNEEVRNLNLIAMLVTTADKNHRRRCGLFRDDEIQAAVRDTIHNLECLTNTALNQRLKFKRLHIRHAALTLCTKDLSHLLLMKPGDLPEPEHTITDPQTNQSRPCQSIDEALYSTKVRTQAYMNPPPVARQCLFGSVTNDSVGPSGFKINTNFEVNDETMTECNPGYSQLTSEAKSYAQKAFLKMGCLVNQPTPDETCLQYPFYFDSNTGSFSAESVATDFYKAIATTPGKARHEGFHLAVIGRMTKPWIDGMILFIQNTLVSRCPPCNIKNQH